MNSSIGIYKSLQPALIKILGVCYLTLYASGMASAEMTFIRQRSEKHGYTIEFPKESNIERPDKPDVDFHVNQSNPLLAISVVVGKTVQPISLGSLADIGDNLFQTKVAKKGHSDFKKAGEGQWQMDGVDVLWRGTAFKSRSGFPRVHFGYFLNRESSYFVISCDGNPDIKANCDRIVRSIRWE